MPSMPVRKTPSDRQRDQRQAQAMNRFGGAVLLLIALGPAAFVAGLLVYPLVKGRRKRLALLALALLVGLVVLGASYRHIYGLVEAVRTIVPPYLPTVRQAARQPNAPNLRALQPLAEAVWPSLRTWWLYALALAPLVGVHLETTRPKHVNELRELKTQSAQDADRQKRRVAASKVKQAPDATKGHLAVVGMPLYGDLGWTAEGWAVYTDAMLNRHAVVVGGSGTGKTEFVLRLAYVARKIYGWKVFYIDAKGDPANAARFRQVMEQAGVRHVPVFPDAPYNGWVGDQTSLFNRLVAVEDYSEPYYKAVAKTVLSLAVKAKSGEPRNSTAFLQRLNLGELATLYEGDRSLRTDALGSLDGEHLDGVLRRYFGFFDALDGKLDGDWSFDTTDAAYLLLEGLALKEEARSLGRYLLEDFANYISRRKDSAERVLLIVDEFSALSEGGADAANLFERLRSFGAGIIVTAQTSEGLGDDAKKLIGAAAVTVAFQCADPEPIAVRAGREQVVDSTYHVEMQTSAGRNPLSSQREHLAGTSIQREQETWKLHPDRILRLAVGECCIITNGAYQMIRVAQVPPAKLHTPQLAQPAAAIAFERPRRPRALLEPEIIERRSTDHSALQPAIATADEERDL